MSGALTGPMAAIIWAPHAVVVTTICTMCGGGEGGGGVGGGGDGSGGGGDGTGEVGDGGGAVGDGGGGGAQQIGPAYTNPFELRY